MRTHVCVLGETYDHQRTLAIRIAAITLASDSVITIDFAHLRSALEGASQGLAEPGRGGVAGRQAAMFGQARLLQNACLPTR